MFNRLKFKILLYFKKAGLDVKTNFHVTLGSLYEMKNWNDNDLEKIKNYLISLDWYLVIAKMEGNNI